MVVFGGHGDPGEEPAKVCSILLACFVKSATIQCIVLRNHTLAKQCTQVPDKHTVVVVICSSALSDACTAADMRPLCAGTNNSSG